MEIVTRESLYEIVWQRLRTIATDAAPGSITPETFARVSVDIVLTELLRAGIIDRD